MLFNFSKLFQNFSDLHQNFDAGLKNTFSTLLFLSLSLFLFLSFISFFRFIFLAWERHDVLATVKLDKKDTLLDMCVSFQVFDDSCFYNNLYISVCF